MTDRFEKARSGRRAPRGLVIEGEIVARSHPARGELRGDEALAGLDLSARADGRPYQSLLDDAIRLARCCGSLSRARWGTVPTSS